MKTIEIRAGFNIYVDEVDFEKIKSLPWKIIKFGDGSCYCGFNVKIGEKKYEKVWLQHMIIGRPPVGKRIYFRDKNPLNCTRSNLAFLTHSEYGHFTHKKVNDKYLGVDTGFMARIRINKKIKVLGVYATAHEAALAYDNEAKKIYGDKAVLNFATDLEEI